MRTLRTVQTLVSGSVVGLTTAAIGFVSTPLLITFLGAERFGAYRATSDCLSYLALLELGIGGAMLPIYAAALARRDEDWIVKSLAAAVRIYCGISICAFVIGCVIAANIHHIVPVTASNLADLHKAALIAAANVLLLPIGAVRGLLDARQRGYVANLCLLLQAAVATLLALILGRTTHSISGQAVAILVGSVCYHAGIVLYTLRMYPAVVQQVFRKSHVDTINQIRKLNVPVFITNVSGKVGIFSDNIVLSAVMGPAIVTPFVVTQRLIVTLQTQLLGTGNASWAGLCELYLSGECERFNRVLAQFGSLCGAFSAFLLVPCVVLNSSFVQLWAGRENDAGRLVTVLAAVNAYTLVYLSLWGWCLSGTGNLKHLSRGAIVQAVINVALSVLLTKRIGVIGPLLGTFVSYWGVGLWYLPTLLTRTMGVPRRILWATFCRPLVGAVVAAIVLSRVVGQVTSWPGLIGTVLLCLGVSAVVSYSIGLRNEDRARLFEITRISVARTRIPIGA